MSNEVQFSLAEGVDLLRRTPALLDGWLRRLEASWLHASEGPGTFSAFEVVGHLIAGEQNDWIMRARQIVERRSGAFAAFDRFRHQQAFAGRTMDALLDEFRVLREANLEQLQALQLRPPLFELRGLHPALGEVSLGQLLATWVVHDQGHIAQIARVLAKRYRTAVGPWREYLPVLSDRMPKGTNSD